MPKPFTFFLYNVNIIGEGGFCMFNKIMAFFTALVTFFSSLFGFGTNYKKYYNSSYGEGKREVYDLAIPKSASGDTGLILFIHGGAWVEGDKESYRGTIEYIASHYNYCAASINYTYVSETTDVNLIIEEITMALSAIKNKANSKGVNINKVVLSGTSAGAHLALLYGYSKVEEAPIKPVAVVSFCGPTDLTDATDFENVNYRGGIYKFLSNVCGYSFDENTVADALPYLEKISPLYYVNESSVPTVIAHGKEDIIVPFAQAENLDSKLTECGVKHDFVVYPNSGHSLSNDKECYDYTNLLFEQYAEQYLK